MDCLGDDLLACTRFAEDQNVVVDLREAINESLNLTHLGATANEVAVPEIVFDLSSKTHVFIDERVVGLT